MFVIAGLGNVGSIYDGTRHNVGFHAVDMLNSIYKAAGKKIKWNAEIAEINVNNVENKILTVKPMLYMNRSGIALSEIIRFYKVPLSSVIVIYDDLDLDLGRVKVKCGGGNAGHNGIKSVDSHIGKDYIRIRVGIGRPKGRMLAEDYVLAKFSSDEYEEILFQCNLVAKNIKCLLSESKLDINDKFAKFMQLMLN